MVDREHRVVYFHGDTTPFLAQPGGEPTRELFTVTRDGVRGPLRAALEQAVESNQPRTIKDGIIDTRHGRRRILITVEPLELQPPPSHFVIIFELVPEPAPIYLPGTPEEQTKAMQELQRVQEQLESTVAQLQNANEQLRASNEEVTSINEELQSTNEELETSKEELQSLNEELTTVNAQFQSKMEELQATSNDLAALLSSTDIAVVFLDRRFRIRRFTPAVKDLVEMLPSDIGRPLSDLAQKFTDPDLIEDARHVLEKLIPIEREVRASADRHYVRRILPYRTLDNRIDGVVVTFMNVTRDRQASSVMRESEEKFRVMVQSVTEFAMFMVDPDGTIDAWNTGAENILGFSPVEAIGQHARMIFTPEDRANGEADKELKRAADKGLSIDERWHMRKNGERFWGSGIVTAIKNQDGRLRGFVKVMRDNTDRKISDEQLLQARRLAEQANKAKDEFLAVVSHELRTPLSVILLWSKMIQSTNFGSDEVKQGIRAIESSAEAQKQLIEDLLDTTRISSGTLRLNLRETDLDAVMKAAVAAIRPAAVDKGISISEDYGKEIGIVQADPDRLQQVVWNLLSNAVKFTQPGGRVEVALTREGTSVDIRVSDTGKGIAPEFLPLMFDRFKQEEGTITRSQGGLGLGLAIAKQLVELHGGTITAHSDGLDRGATFHVHLPLPRTRKTRFHAAATLSAVDASNHPLEGAKILLVEDNPASAEAMKVLLTRLGADIELAGGGAEAIRLFRDFHPALLISDIAMPDMDGYTLIRKIREIERETKAQALPAVALSAFTREDDRSKAIEAGFDQHIAKPLDTQKLVATLVELLRAE